MDLIEGSRIEVIWICSFQKLWAVEVAWASVSISVLVLCRRELLGDMVWLRDFAVLELGPLDSWW